MLKKGVFIANELITLEAAERNNALNPVQEFRLRELRRSGSSGNPAGIESPTGSFLGTAGVSQVGQADFTREQRARGEEFLGRFTTGIKGAISGIETELGLPGLRQGVQQAGQVARGVAGQVRDIPGTQRTIAKQVGISAPRLAQRTAAKTAELQPSLETAQRGLTEATAAQQFGEEAFATRLGQYITPFQIEAGLLGDSVKQEFDLYKSSIKNALDLKVAELASRTDISIAEIQEATRMAEIEQATLSGSFTDLGNRVALINPQTGEELASFIKGLTPSRGVSGIAEWEGV